MIIRAYVNGGPPEELARQTIQQGGGNGNNEYLLRMPNSPVAFSVGTEVMDDGQERCFYRFADGIDESFADFMSHVETEPGWRDSLASLGSRAMLACEKSFVTHREARGETCGHITTDGQPLWLGQDMQLWYMPHPDRARHLLGDIATLQKLAAAKSIGKVLQSSRVIRLKPQPATLPTKQATFHPAVEQVAE